MAGEGAEVKTHVLRMKMKMEENQMGFDLGRNEEVVLHMYVP